MNHPTDEELDAMVKRLTWHREHPVTGKLVYANEDGPDAAAAFTALRAQLAEVRQLYDLCKEQLRFASRRADRAEAERAAQIEVDAGICAALEKQILSKQDGKILEVDANLRLMALMLPDAAMEISTQPHNRTALDLMLAEAREKALGPAVWLIHKAGRGWYRPNAQGYTNNVADAGRYTYTDAMRHSHPNGPEGPRDGMTIKHVDNALIDKEGA